MAFTVGWPIGSSAVSVEYADSYFADRNVTAWAGTTAAKQGALVRATDYVKALFASRFDPSIFADVAPLLPDNLEKAVCEYAIIELKKAGALAPIPVTDGGFTLVATKKKIGPIEKTFSVVGGDSATPGARLNFPVADALIASLLLPSLGQNRVYR